ncbi:MAG: hypothetical protein L6366_02200 [Candidatus Omnitrophica bacterium]|nr:hypothetical protein [Candidatus Omnitrophota bacterium]
MAKKCFCAGIFIAGIIILAYSSLTMAQEAKTPLTPRISGTGNQSVFGVVGKVDYVECRSRGESEIILKDKKGESVKISMNVLRNGATVLTTYRKEKDKKGKEQNVLVSLSIIKTAQEAKEAEKKKK